MRNFQRINLVNATFCLLFLACTAVFASEDKFAKGVELFNKQSYAEALQTFNEIPANGDREAQRLYYCALCYSRSSQPKNAERFFKRICASFPNSQAAEFAKKYLAQGISAGATVVNPPLPSTASAESMPDEISIPFQKTSKGQLSVTAELQGRSMNMIFDTGAEECLFGVNQMQAANLSDVTRSRPAVLHSVAGPVSVYQVSANLKLGALRRTLPVCVQEHDMDAAILGQPFLRGYSCIVDNQAGFIRLHRQGAAANSSTLDSVAVPFTLDGDKLIVAAQMNGLNLDMCFDTGSFGVCISKTQSQLLGLKLPDIVPERTKGPNGSQVASWHIVADVTLGPIRKRAFPVRVIDSEISHPLLGENFFGDRTYTIDREKKEIRFAR